MFERRDIRVSDRVLSPHPMRQADRKSSFRGAGAVAELFDISCLAKRPAFTAISDAAFNLWNAAPAELTQAKVSSAIRSLSLPGSVGQHYFIPTEGGTAPKWDMTSTGPNKGKADAFVVVAKAPGIPAPTGPKDVDWLSLKATSGALATQVFRTHTRGGPPPPSVSVRSPRHGGI